jgi:GntR family transcriptional repressor for pyruvate dehydrogenase complex
MHIWEGTVMFRPVKKQRVYVAVAEQILDMVRSGRFSEGSKLPTERQLGELLGVSRASIREALSSLEFIGVLESRVGDGTYVLGPGAAPARGLAMLEDQHSPFDILAARLLIEPKVAELAANHRMKQDLSKLRGLLEEMEEAVRNQTYGSEVDHHFHIGLAAATQNDVLVSLMEYLFGLTQEELWQMLKQPVEKMPAYHRRYLEQHWAILAAVEAEDSARAAREMRLHLEQVETDILAESEARKNSE